MPIWTRTPPREGGDQGKRLLRTPANKPILACATSLEILGCNTHFINGRTIPCEGPGQCRWDDEGFTYRWHGYLGALMIDTLEHFIFEFTANASDAFTQYNTFDMSLRGCLFKAERHGKRMNGKVIIHCKPADLAKLTLPKPLDVRAILCHIWNIQNTDAETHTTPSRPGKLVTVKDNGRDGRIR